ncbi:hypothetical protein [Crenobacter cavernae]|uniref:hypothetical protein n=1 Tax=Crenobacter cavernae TaxID=2290923 RepID=UPI00141A35E4|nr:hypothetical protein [Crenobacter cavernae]
MGTYVFQLIVIPLFLSLSGWLLLRSPLTQVSRALCGSGKADGFWPRTFLLILLFGPLLATLLFAPPLSSGDFWLDTRRILQWGLVGVLGQLLVMLRVVWLLVVTPQLQKGGVAKAEGGVR